MPAPRETFIKVSDHMDDHHKIVGLSDKGFRSVMRLWMWCSRNRTDGHVPAGVWRDRAPGKTARELIQAGLAHDDGEGGAWMHDYLTWQRSREQIEALSEKRSKAGRQGGRPATSTKQPETNLVSNEEAAPPPYTDRGGTTYLPDREPEQTFSSEIADAIPDSDSEDEPREDVEALCQHLADRVEGNGSKRPRITTKWRTEARLLLDRDKRDPAKVHNLIDWSQDHHHWKTRVMAMPKFRSEYDAIRLQALTDYERRQGRPQAGSRPSASDEAAARAQSLRRTPRASSAPAPDAGHQPALRLAEGF